MKEWLVAVGLIVFCIVAAFLAIADYDIPVNTCYLSAGPLPITK